ncbi:energy-coupling factor transporter transmembrane component T [Qaidamihabitans albus]|uniref:energy-coupling factor transporter transmembrane component T n=1 Tax=Qaidamihabitans albus TaxID=2795733 RepID=UPI003557BC22
MGELCRSHSPRRRHEGDRRSSVEMRAHWTHRAGIRAVPVVVGFAEEIRDAQRARGLTTSPRAFAVPLIVRALRHADTLANALVARGLAD